MADNDNNLVFTVSSDMSAAQRGLAKFSNDVGAATDQIARKYQAAGAKIDSATTALQTRINGVVGLGTKATKEWTGALADQGKELERLRAQYNPLFATLNNYKATVADIKRAHAIGAISADEMTAAISKERQAALASTAAIKARNAALGSMPKGIGANDNSAGRAFQTANIAAQFQDIAVQLQGGGKPLTVALQQGTQLAGIFQTLGKGESVIGALGAAFSSLVSPVSLVTIGLIAAGGAAYQYFSSVATGGSKSEETLKKEAELIQQVADKWGGVLPELKKYADERQKLVDQKEQKDAVAAAASQQWDELRKKLGETTAAYAQWLQTFNDQGADPAKIGALQTAYEKFSKGVKDGNATAEEAKAVQTALLDLMQVTGVKAVGDFAKTFDQLATSIGTASERATKLKSDLDFSKNFPASRLPTLGTIGPVYSDNGKLLTDPNEIDRYNKQQQENRNPTIDTGRGLPVPVPIPGQKPIQLGEEPNKKAETAATKAANAYRDLLKAADDRIEQIQQETDLLGKYGVDADAARFALDLFQRSEDKGRSLSAEQRKEIEKKVALYKQYSETLSKAKLQQDLLMDARYNSLSKQDQQITSTLRQYGLPEDLNSAEAGQIRQSLNLEDARSELKSFFGDFKNAMLNNGGDIGEAFANAIQNAALNQLSKLADKLIDTLVNAILGSTGGGAGAASGGGGIGAAIGSAISGGITGKAPVTAVTRAPLGDISAYAKAIQSIESGGNYGALGPLTKSGDRAYGAYQVMGANIPSWTKGALGRSLSPNEFLSSRTAQDAVFEKYFGASVSKFGNPQDAASVWFTGRPLSNGAGASDILGTTGSEYVDKFTKSLGNASDAINVQMGRTTAASESLGGLANSSSTATEGLGQFGSGLNKFGSSLSSMGGGGGWGQPSGGGGFDWASLFSPSWKPNTTFGAFLGLADGGHVAGPGGPTSDSIPAMLSNGEYVVNAEATRKHRRLLEAINSGSVARLARGGLVSTSVAPSGGSSSGRDNVQVNIINSSGAQVSKKERKTSSGKALDVFIDDIVADKMSMPGSRSRGAVQSQFSLKSGLAKR